MTSTERIQEHGSSVRNWGLRKLQKVATKPRASVLSKLRPTPQRFTVREVCHLQTRCRIAKQETALSIRFYSASFWSSTLASLARCRAAAMHLAVASRSQFAGAQLRCEKLERSNCFYDSCYSQHAACSNRLHDIPGARHEGVRLLIETEEPYGFEPQWLG